MFNINAAIPGLAILFFNLLIIPVMAQNRFEPEIKKFEATDQVTSPPAQAILFVGSSSIRGWKVEKFFPGLPVINRGFGGSEMSDVLHYFDRVVVPYKPDTIVFYSGDNDISSGKTTTTVIADMTKFVSLVHEKLPATHVLLIPPKPSTSRWKIWPQMQEVGEAERKLAETDELVTYINIVPEMLGPYGKPRAELLKKDGLHMTDEGYAIWSDLVRPLLQTKDNLLQEAK